MNINAMVRSREAGLFPILLLAAGLLVLGGCARTKSPLPVPYDENGIPRAIKRIEQYPQRDFFHHWVRKAYVKPDHMFKPVGSSQRNVVKQWGRPDWVRKPFRSLENDRVVEWLYMDKLRLFQFIGPDLVFDGPLTDYEQALLTRGYPDRSHLVRRENGEREDLFIYYKLFTPWLEQFNFRDGRLIQSQEGY